jgi:hypothetical protein
MVGSIKVPFSIFYWLVKSTRNPFGQSIHFSVITVGLAVEHVHCCALLPPPARVKV